MNQARPAPENCPCPRHPSTETRLRCTECELPICPKCMVMYEAGFKCPACAKRRPSHVSQATGGQWIMGGAGALLAGVVYGWLHPWLVGLPFFRPFGIPVLGFVLAYLLGRSLGQGLQGLIRYKYMARLPWTIMTLGLIGACWGTPFQQAVFQMLEVVSAPQYVNAVGTSATFYVLGSGLPLLGVLVFLRGLAQPFRPPG